MTAHLSFKPRQSLRLEEKRAVIDRAYSQSQSGKIRLYVQNPSDQIRRIG
jgi:hypothetical protein